MIEKPKKERRFLKALGRVGEILLQEVLIKVGSSLIKRIGGKKQVPSILFLFLSISLYGQFPININKQRLGFQTTADGLVWRGSLSDTASIQPVSNQYAWVILDTVNLKLYSFDFTSNVWNQVPSGSTVDTTSLSNRINLKLNISDTAAMLLPYAKKSYVDTAGRFYARQDFTNVSSSTLTWTQTDTLVPAGVNVVQVYRNGQILLPTQYTIPTNASVVIGATAFKLGENYTVIFPKGGGGSGSGGSGSLTSISGGTGITVSPDPITTTGTVSADLSVLMELSDTVTLSNRINNKVNISDTASMLLPYFRDADTSLLNLTSRFALKLNAADTASLSSRINTKGTVSSVATGFGLLGGTITTTGTLLLDSAVVFTRIRDSIVDVAIGNDTIKILKQEYAPATTSVLTWTVTPKFPIQLKAYILVFRNGQLLNNDQYNLTDTNKITIVSTSFKVGANYTVATVSGIGSIGTGVFPNPVYPEAGIALSTGSAWASSITNNSVNWNIAYNDKINNAVFTGTDTKTLTLTQLDGGTFAPTFTDLQGVTGVTAGTGLTGGTISTTGTLAVDFGVVAPLANPTFTGTVGGITKSMVGLGNVDNTSDANKPISSATQTALNLKFNTADTTSLNLTSRFAAKQNTLTNPVTGTGTTNTLPLFTGTSTLGNSVIQESSGNIGIGVAPTSNLELAKGKFITLNSSGSPFQDSSGIMLYEVGTKTANDINFGAKIMYNGDSDNFEIKMKNFNGTTLFNPPVSISIPRVTGNVNIGTSLAVTGNITEGGNNVLTNLDTASLSTRIDAKLSATDTVSLSNRINNKVGLTGNETVAGEKTFSGMMTLNGGLKGKILKQSGTSGFFNPIPSDVVTYIFEYTGLITGGGTTDFLGSPASHTNRIINIINVSDVDYFLGFMTNKPYTKTSTQLDKVDYGQSITVQSDGSKWYVISRNF